ncbi:MAG: DUF4375 domain-containing protein [Saprospiraceae bacterium]|nr:DUF4375 domain-containing protein [Saprospiraceae bacterium]
MQIEDSNSELSWMTEKVKNEMLQREKIVKEQDIDSLFLIPESDFFSIVLHGILCNRCNNKPETLNSTQRVLFLCMHLENAGQADSILAFLQEWYPEYADEVVYALNEIGATKSAEIIRQAVELLPKNGSWFFDIADESAINLMEKLDRDFSCYPDGFLCELYRKYADKHRGDI